MNYRAMYQCKCGKIFDKNTVNIPTYCPKCARKLIATKYLYNKTDSGEETSETNCFGGYDYIKCKENKENLKRIIGYRRFFKLHKLKDSNNEDE